MKLQLLLFLPALVYQLLALYAGLSHWLKQRRQYKEKSMPRYRPGVSVLKPLRGTDIDMYRAFVSQARQNYPSFELIFGVRDEHDPAVPLVRQLQAECSDVEISLAVGIRAGANHKTATLTMLAEQARYPIWVINDSDILVDPEYLGKIVEPLRDESVGVVTCLYRPQPHSLPAEWEALGIASDFMPSTLVAPLVGVREFGLGSTLAFRACDLEAAGGFADFADYLADDYQLSCRLTRGGKRKAVLSSYVVETALSDETWLSIWQHQTRWARTIRLTKGAGYLGLPFTQAGMWAIVACALSQWWIAFMLCFVRILAGVVTGGFVLRTPVIKRWFLAIPLWDVFAFAVWLSSYTSNEVRWRDRIFAVDGKGRIMDRNPS